MIEGPTCEARRTRVAMSASLLRPYDAKTPQNSEKNEKKQVLTKSTKNSKTAKKHDRYFFSRFGGAKQELEKRKSAFGQFALSKTGLASVF